MGLNRVQKRNLAIVLVSQAQEVVEDWHSFKQKQYPGVPDDALDELSQDDVRHRFAGWLQYLPGKPAASMLLDDDEELDQDQNDSDGDDDNSSDASCEIQDEVIEDDTNETQSNYAPSW
jgi:hypothetical protein